MNCISLEIPQDRPEALAALSDDPLVKFWASNCPGDKNYARFRFCMSTGRPLPRYDDPDDPPSRYEGLLAVDKQSFEYGVVDPEIFGELPGYAGVILENRRLVDEDMARALANAKANLSVAHQLNHPGYVLGNNRTVHAAKITDVRRDDSIASDQLIVSFDIAAFTGLLGRDQMYGALLIDLRWEDKVKAGDYVMQYTSSTGLHTWVVTEDEWNSLIFDLGKQRRPKLATN
jgi:hypothetical protein